ncbi:MAG: hypothetical protein R3B13_07110 [Polyangiaceae bacterium]
MRIWHQLVTVAVGVSFPSLALAQPAAETDQCLDAYVAAQRLQKKRELTAAKEALLVCARASCPAALVRDCAAWLGDVERRTPSVVVEVVEGSTRVTPKQVFIDSTPVPRAKLGSAIDVDPGERQIVAVLEGGQRLTTTAVVLEGDRGKRIRLEHSNEGPPPQRDLTPVYVLGGVSALAFGSFALFAVRSHSKRADLEDCRGHCAEDDVDAVRREQIVADVSLSIGVLAAAGAAYFAFRPTEQTRVGASATGQGAVATFSHRF